MGRTHRKLLRIVAPVALWLALGCTAIPINIPQTDGGSMQDAPKLLYDAGAETGMLLDLVPPGHDGPISIGDGAAADGGFPPPGDAGPDGQVTDGLVDGLPVVPDGLPTDGLPDGVPADALPDAGSDSGLADTTVGEGV